MTLVTVIEVGDDVLVCRAHDDGRSILVENDAILYGEVAVLSVGDIDEGLLLITEGALARRCQVVATGNTQTPKVRLLEGGVVRGEFSAAALGLLGYSEAQQVQNKVAYLLLNLDANPPGHWDYEGGINAWREAVVAARAAEVEQDLVAREAILREKARQSSAIRRDQAAAERAAVRVRVSARERAAAGPAPAQVGTAASATEIRQRPQAGWNTRFANPYCFVPFPQGEDGCPRSKPCGHDRLDAQRLAGTITVVWETITPLLTGAGTDGFSRRPTPSGAQYVLPGSSVKGAVRSLHETLAGGCLRVFDVDFVPVYRDAAIVRPDDDDWTLARVEKVDGDGRPTRMSMCADIVWVLADLLHSVVPPHQLRTGSLVNLDPARANRGRSGRKELVAPGAVSPGTEWIVLVTDASARDPRHPYYCATGKLTEPQAVGVADDVWQRYLGRADGTRDVRLARHHGAENRSIDAEVHFGRFIGRRRTAALRLAPGEVVWARMGAQGEVEEITLSYLWRHEGRGSLGERVPEWLHPCRTPDRLCVSCQLFGSVDAEGGRQAGGARNDGYRGHLRVGDAVAGASTRPMLIPLAPLGSPRPGAGQFYLRHGPDGLGAAARDQRPTREWGATPDFDPETGEFVPRLVRGRKHYWHGDPGATGRHLARPHHGVESMAVTAEILPEGTTLECGLSFENLSEAELGGLIAALDPARLLTPHVPEGFTPNPEIAAHLGGGKPLGLGSVRVVQLRVQVHTVASRYQNCQPSRVRSPDPLVATFAATVPATVLATWPDLAAALAVGHVNPAAIWYPPGAWWDRRGSQEFDDGFTFWKASSGQFLQGASPDMVALADPREADQYHFIDRGRQR